MNRLIFYSKPQERQAAETRANQAIEKVQKFIDGINDLNLEGVKIRTIDEAREAFNRPDQFIHDRIRQNLEKNSQSLVGSYALDIDQAMKMVKLPDRSGAIILASNLNDNDRRGAEYLTINKGKVQIDKKALDRLTQITTTYADNPFYESTLVNIERLEKALTGLYKDTEKECQFHLIHDNTRLTDLISVNGGNVTFKDSIKDKMRLEYNRVQNAKQLK